MICGDELCETSRERGVKPLVARYAGGMRYAGCVAADKVVGKATAYLYVLLQVEAVWAGVISRCAEDVLRAAGIAVSYDTLVENIINRTGDGICPFETAVLEIEDPVTAYHAIREKMAELNITI